METIRGKIENKRTETQPSKKTGNVYTKTYLTLGSVEYNMFGTTNAMQSDEVTLEYEPTKWGNDIEKLTNHTKSMSKPDTPPRVGPKEKKSEARPTKAMEQFELDMQRMQARTKALDSARYLYQCDEKFVLKDFLKIAEDIEDWIMRDTPKILESAHIDIIVDHIIDVVQADKDGKVSCEKIDGVFIVDQLTRDNAYKKAQDTKQVEILNGFWFDKARSG